MPPLSLPVTFMSSGYWSGVLEASICSRVVLEDPAILAPPILFKFIGTARSTIAMIRLCFDHPLRVLQRLTEDHLAARGLGHVLKSIQLSDLHSGRAGQDLRKSLTVGQRIDAKSKVAGTYVCSLTHELGGIDFSPGGDNLGFSDTLLGGLERGIARSSAQ